MTRKGELRSVPVAEERTIPKPAKKRLNVELSERTYGEIKEIAASYGVSVSTFTRIALEIFRQALVDKEEGYSLSAIRKSDGLLTKEYLIPL